MITLLLVLSAYGQDYAFPSTAAHYAFWYPTAYRDQGGFDWNCGTKYYSGHRGSDYGGGSFAGMDEGRDIVASAPGFVDFVNDGEFDRCTSGTCEGGGGFGNFVKLKHPDGKNTFYAHLKQGSTTVTAGQRVTCGQKLGEMGSSGNSTGPHIHFELRQVDGASMDPFFGSCGNTRSFWTNQGIYNDLPGLTCDATPPTCTPRRDITCGDTINERNDIAGSTSQTMFYGCTEFTYDGPEVAYTLRSAADEPVTVRVTGLSADLDVYLTRTARCDGLGCMEVSHNPNTSDEEVTFDATADQAYTVILDGWQGAVSDFTLTVVCDTPWIAEEQPEPIDTSEEGTPSEDTASDAEPGPPNGNFGGCACDSAPGAPVGWLLLGAAALLRRRSSTQ